MNDDDLRRELRGLAHSYGDADQLRREVRWRLESLDADDRVTLPLTRPTGPWTRRLVLAAAAACCLLVLGGVVLVERQGGPERLATESTEPAPSSADTAIAVTSTPDSAGSAERFESELTSPGVTFDLPDEPVVEIVSETSDSIEFAVDGSGDSGRLIVALPSVEDVAAVNEAVGWLEASPLVDIESVEERQIGDASFTRIRMGSTESMAVVGFRFGTNTFISASGESRSYEALLSARSDGGIVIVWIDAPEDSIADVAPIAESVLASLSTGR